MLSESYRKEQERLHENPAYGVASVHYAPLVTQIIDKIGATEMLDYGCGKGRLAKSIQPKQEITVKQYDPGIPELSELPDSAQFVCCIDVLEHVEPDYLDDVLDDLQRVTEFYGFFTVHTGPAVKTLSDGRNAHLIQEGSQWWLPKIMQRFELLQFNTQEHGFYVLVKRCHSAPTQN